MSDNGKYYGLKREDKRSDFFKSFPNSDKITDKMLYIIDKKISEIKPTEILDLGTGNGFLIREVYKRNRDVLKSSKLIGIDSSSQMIEIAKRLDKKSPIEFTIMDNNATNFPDSHFDLIIAKAVSNISVPEVYRILKNGGWFIYKEYGSGKGIVELMEIMKGKSSHSGNSIIKQMEEIDFSSFELRNYYIPLLKSIEEAHAVIDTMRILPKKTSHKDAHKNIDKYYDSDKSKVIHSDPYLIIGQK